jgi:protoporphyrinogen oxidase
MTKSRVVIIGAGPAGLTAAYELATAGVTDVVVLEATRDIGGLAKTVNYKGNRIDIGGHRFFSKSDWVMDWWLHMLPLAREDALDAKGRALLLAYQGKRRSLRARSDAPDSDEHVMLVRSRLSRIYFDGKFFDYPLKADLDTALKLGLGRCLTFAASYLHARLFPLRPERTLEDFFINRFGRRLYLQFFKSYTEKVWGTPCEHISAEWGAQRVKSLSISKALRHALLKLLRVKSENMGQAEQTSLIERFLYPKYGPGWMWETTVQQLRERGVTIVLDAPVTRLEQASGRISAVQVRRSDGKSQCYEADHFVSTMPVRDLVLGLEPHAPPRVREVAAGLDYRDFITVGLLYKRLLPTPSGEGPLNLVPDNWIYVQEAGVKVGRLQIFNNWSPYMVRDSNTVWIGLEYFCREGDELWQMPDDDLVRLGVEEMRRLRLADTSDHLDGVVIRMPKAYPGYYGTYARFNELRDYLDRIPNLFLVGRNGMHRYNNQDHSMLSAKLAVEAILSGSSDKSAIWDVNIDDEYHEEQSSAKEASVEPAPGTA